MYQLQNFISQKIEKLFEQSFQRVFLYTYTASSANLSFLAFFVAKTSLVNYNAEHMRNKFYRTLSIRGTNLIACWAYGEPISLHAEHARKCLKVEYLGPVEFDFQKSLWTIRFRLLQKKSQKNSCLCTFKGLVAWCHSFFNLLAFLSYIQYVHIFLHSWSFAEAPLHSLYLQTYILI